MAEKAASGWNLVVVVSDTLRTAYLGAYGNKWIHTPNLDRFAQDSVRFTNAHPECLPTIPKRTKHCLLYTSPSPRDRTRSRMPSSA